MRLALPMLLIAWLRQTTKLDGLAVDRSQPGRNRALETLVRAVDLFRPIGDRGQVNVVLAHDQRSLVTLECEAEYQIGFASTAGATVKQYIGLAIYSLELRARARNPEMSLALLLDELVHLLRLIL